LRNDSTPVTTVLVVGRQADDLDLLAHLDLAALDAAVATVRGRRWRDTSPPASGTAVGLADRLGDVVFHGVEQLRIACCPCSPWSPCSALKRRRG